MRSQAIVLRRGPPPSLALLAAQLRLAGLVAEVTAAEHELRGEAEALAAFEARWRDATGDAFAELDRARQLLRRVERLGREVARLAAAREESAPPTARRAPGRSAPREAPRRTPPRAAAARALPEAAPALLDEGADLKALYRRLARALHPDLSRAGAAERARRSELMARANEAYARGDRAALELLSERIGATDGPLDVPEEDHLALLARRIAALQAMRAQLLDARARLARSPAARLREDAARRAAAGVDAAAEARAEAAREAATARDAALRALDAVAAAARAVAPAPGGHDARARGRLPASAVVRTGRVALDARRATPAARALARTLAERVAGPAGWEAALTVLAFVCDAAGRPPASLATAAALAATWDALRARWPAAPDLGRALARLPRQLELGLRPCDGGLEAGLQLASADLAAGVRLALRDAGVRAVAREALASLGSRARCGACRAEVAALHLLRVAGPEQVHGLVCPRCGRSFRTFWHFGEPSGMDALQPVAVEVGLVAEQRVRVGRASFAFQMTPRQREHLTARAILGTFRALCLEPAGVAVAARALRLEAAGAPLRAGDAVPAGAALVLRVAAAAGLGEQELVDRIRAHARARFRP